MPGLDDANVRYQDEIAKLVPHGIDPRHIEAYMRVQYSTLDHLDSYTFKREVKLCVECVRVGGLEAAEAAAQSFGL